jgi:hypothetical protein
VAFNKSIADEAKGKFPGYVTCQTIHSLAYQQMKGEFDLRNRLSKSGKYDLNEIEVTLNISDRKEILKYLHVVDEFCKSDYDSIRYFYMESYLHKFPLNISEDVLGLHNLDVLWTYLTESGESTLTHQIYLKAFQLSKPNLNFPVIIIDETQDLNDVVLDIILNQHKLHKAQLIAIGDPFQSIYGWNGAVESFGKLRRSGCFDLNLYLTDSFRFGAEIADQANVLLDLLGAIPVSGVRTDKTTNYETVAKICRTNAGVFSELEKCLGEQKKAYVIGDIEKTYFAKIKAAKCLQLNSYAGPGDKKYTIYDSYINSFKSWNEFLENSASDPELSVIVSIINRYKSDLFQILKTLSESVLVKKQSEADILLMTAHKSKGLEFDYVEISSDFNLKKEETFGIETPDLFDGELGNLLYVAFTRAKYELNLSNLNLYLDEKDQFIYLDCDSHWIPNRENELI